MLGVFILVLVVLTKNIAAITCEFCNRNFVLLERFTWRSKVKTTVTTVATVAGVMEANHQSPSLNTRN